MSEVRLSPEVEGELDDIWLHVAQQSLNIDIATRVVENITERFGCWHNILTSVVHVMTCVGGYAVFRLTTTSSSIGLKQMT